jgi:dienelactone hydrolase
MRPIILLLGLLAFGGCQEQPVSPAAAASRGAGPEAPPAGPWREQIHWLPVGDRLIQARLCRPPGEAPAPLVVINHGSPADPARRPGTRATSCSAEAAQWFLGRGQAVLFPLRRGYGASGGGWAESYGRCATPDFAAAGRETARDIAASIRYATQLPGIRPERVLVVGQSAGGWGALALAAENPPQVAAIVNMAGGRGGWAEDRPNSNCRPDLLVQAAGVFGQTARIPTLWVYTANDTYFAPELAARMHEAFTQAGAVAAMRALPAWRSDGHSLFFGSGGSTGWGPILDAWLAPQGL